MERRRDGNGTIIKLTKEEFSQFFELIKNINLKNIFILKEKYEIKNKENNLKKISIELKLKSGNLELENNRAFVEYQIKLKDGKKIFYTQETKYEVELYIKNKEEVIKILKNENIEKFFIEKQLNKIAWPFLRVDFHNNLARVGIKPITLPLLK